MPETKRHTAPRSTNTHTASEPVAKVALGTIEQPRAKEPTTGVLRFERDHLLRQRLFVEESFNHCARANLYLLRYLIRHYTQVGDHLLDPMAGTGSLLIASVANRHVTLIDLEERWTKIMHANAQKITSSTTFFEPGSITILQADAAKLPLESCSIDHVITSPPYWDTFSDWNITTSGFQGELGPLGQAYADDRGTPSSQTHDDGLPLKNIGNLHHYELYLRAMRLVYQEVLRVLEPGGRCLVIVKDRVHKRRRVPITNDTSTLLQATGFSSVATLRVLTNLSHYRILLARRCPDAPVIDSEAVLVFQKPSGRSPDDHTARALAIITRPNRQYGPGQAPRLLFEKSLAHAKANQAQIYILDDELPQANFQRRRRLCHSLVADLVASGTIRAGRRVILHTPARYARYLKERLETLGCPTSNPTAGMNMGQKLAFLTHTSKQT